MSEEPPNLDKLDRGEPILPQVRVYTNSGASIIDSNAARDDAQPTESHDDNYAAETQHTAVAIPTELEKSRANPTDHGRGNHVELDDRPNEAGTANGTQSVEPEPGPTVVGVSENNPEEQNDSPQESPAVIDLTLDDSDDDDDNLVISTPINPSVSAPRIKQELNDETHEHILRNVKDNGNSEFAYHDLPALGNTDIPDEHDLDQDAPADITPEAMQAMLHEFIQNNEAVGIPSVFEADSDNEEMQRRSDFQSLKAAYEKKKKSSEFTMVDRIEFQRASDQEQVRIRARQNRKQQERDEIEKHMQETTMFIPEDPVSNNESDGLRHDHAYANKFPSPDDETEVEVSTKKKGRGGRQKSKSDAGSTLKKTAGNSRVSKKQQGSGGTGKKRGKKSNQTPLIDVKSLFHHDIIAEATANQAKSGQANFTAKNRKDALSQLISSIPQEERNLHMSDKVALDKALSKFNGRGAIRSDGQGGWLLKGMNSSLKSYQVLGVSWMRDRENQTRNPRGGILGDDMGLGKTVSTLANIVDGRPPTDYNRARATLVIVPPTLMSQWLEETEKHVNSLKKVMVYRSKMKMMNMAQQLGDQDIVITSYHEVMRSLPKNNPPPNLFTPQAKAEWWAKQIEIEKGPLHRVFWYRIVLDEAQAIKNHLSRTSEAICYLRGQYRWCLSGTPVQNSLEEFFPYFKFLKCENTGNFELFKRNFAKRGSEKALQRLQVYLGKIMLRRTHRDEFLGNPIVKLPPISPVETKIVKFNAVEHAVYNIVKKRFILKVHTLAKKDTPGDSYGQILVLLLRLRQLVGHPLLIQKTLKELLESEDLERLWALTKQRTITQPNVDVTSDGNEETARALKLAIEASNESSKNGESSSASRAQIDNELSVSYRKILEAFRTDGNWAKANLRSVCVACSNPPTNPYITSCLHLYCFICLSELRHFQLLEGKEKATCSECSANIDTSSAYAATAYDEANRNNNNGRLTPEEDIDWYKIGGPILRSAKVKGAVEQIKKWFEEDPTNKILVFTQFRGLIKIMERVCREEDGWGYASYHGAMAFDYRDQQVRKFTTDPDCRILLAALKAGGLGLNLTAANRVIIFDLWWNMSVESQAFTRCFRIGQKRDVKVVRFVVHDSIDTDIQRMQERKIKEIGQAMDNRLTLTTAEMLELFSDGSHRKNDPESQQIEMQGGEDEDFVFPDDPYDVQDQEDDVVMLD